MLAQNRRAKFDYFLEESFEAGIVLFGPEVKSIRAGQVSLNEAFVDDRNGEIFLFNCHVNPYKPSRVNYEPTRPRKLLLHKKQISKLFGNMERKGYTIVPTKMYLNDRGLIKVQISIAKGKSNVDKRHSIADRDWDRRKQRKEFD